MTRVALPWTSPTRKFSCARANRRLGVTNYRRPRAPFLAFTFARGRRADERLALLRAAARRPVFLDAPARAVEERLFVTTPLASARAAAAAAFRWARRPLSSVAIAEPSSAGDFTVRTPAASSAR